MVEPQQLKNYARWLRESITLNHEDFESLTYLLDEAAAEIEAGANARLVQYRTAALTAVVPLAAPLDKESPEFIAKRAEDIAHAMLAAERVPKTGDK